MPIKIIIASDSFKGSLTSEEAGKAAGRGIKTALPDAQVEIVPVADGGEGTVDALCCCLNGEKVRVKVSDPHGDVITAEYAISGDTAVIEIASASGLTLIPPERRNPRLTTSFGTGELIRDALTRGCRNFLIGLGGSATNDAGVGMLSALGYRFLDSEGNPIGFGGEEVGRIKSIDDSQVMPELMEASFTVACDVTNPLTGPNGASRIFGPQKGADSESVKELDEALVSFAQISAKTLGSDFSTHPGAGAAGGLGFAFLSFLNGNLRPGIEMVLDAVGFDSRIEGASLIITGEGKLDRQTCMGKAPYGVLQRAKTKGIPVIALGGSIEPDAIETLMHAGFRAAFPIVPGPVSIEEAMRPEVASANIERTLSQLIRIFNI
ncbi:MAG: glycerate kinase [Muribaculaceae bacterium]|nr:glycerate kinase [Muribaculaceae bacterium]